ncbi:hypothetical protein A3D01_00345 [Candidatus Woesebacteria bacterium RIFCSPHIGHO2_02_FULL_39_13]|uniref:Carbamoyltransferase n=1 Tax=Candidatus Woesebacteria bacterium RIFCSPHIGHO2_02_FULL_39_13 TaxID=1802505 RepID=A0A1F7Z0Z8_9BACT|nr:MAG: hypothetical protein A2692_04635 [Candidatus Woesebacteria bacterium RIFCSPHIGHO2_01_FULL_39_95]OGM33326.1 MAG: hypothetical protein A3D01_00345 [Candidatus Woesebacteria bacterium RIFCSPHIGHO2_02_FULL_39_13]
MYILGISAFYHDSAACLLKDGKILSAVEEERFTRIKHDNSFPYNAISFCLRASSLEIGDIDYVSYYEKPLVKFERILETFVQTYPFSVKPFIKGIPEWLSEKIKVGEIIKKKIGFGGEIFFVPHHLSHAASSFFTSGFDEAAVLTIDGVGDRPTTGLWGGSDKTIENLSVINFPHSLGLFYSTFTSFLGFRVNNDEYKVMGLAAYGRPIYSNLINNEIIKVKNDGSFKLNLKYFAYPYSPSMYSRNFIKLFGRPRIQNGKIKERDRNLAASLQKVIEEIYFKMLNHLYDVTKSKNLCIGGGVALNSLANGKIYKYTPFTSVYIFGPAGDNGAAIGAALYTYRSILNNSRKGRIKSLALGSSYTDREILKVLNTKGLSFKKFKDKKDLINKTARLLTKDKIIGWFQGRMEFGPRALGNRSILANPREPGMKDKVNLIKKREKFRPFAGSVIQDKVHELFSVPEKKHSSPFMNFCFKVKKDRERLISAIVHKDKTCRIQTVNKDNGIYYYLIRKFYELSGCPCILNTSFNLNNEPIVETPTQAINDFESTSIDFLVIGGYLVWK